MAKSARATRIKRNNQALKKKVFGPVETARTERLHAKLLELAHAPKEEKTEEVERDGAEEIAVNDDERDVEMGTGATAKTPKSKREIQRLQAARAQRVEKSKRRKPRNQVTFPAHPKKKKAGKR